MYIDAGCLYDVHSYRNKAMLGPLQDKNEQRVQAPASFFVYGDTKNSFMRKSLGEKCI